MNILSKSTMPDFSYQVAKAYGASAPSLIIYNSDLAHKLGLTLNESDLADYFSGNKILEGSEPVALAYAGHQFGHFVPSLGDGRALLLGEIKGFDLQLKGSGRTFFSRSGDGKSALGPVLREYLISEFMHKIGVPTTRSLAAVLTGDVVYREETLPGAILTRVASSHLRIGTFEYFASRGDLEALKKLTEYAMNRHYPEVKDILSFFKAVCLRQAKLVASWMGLGFIHGVMNTDNMSISGETIDYGPCAFMDFFKHDQVYSYIDRNGRYAYDQQTKILVWNLSRLASCLIPLIDNDENKAIKILEEALHLLPEIIDREVLLVMNKKFGFGEVQSGDKEIHQLWFDYLEAEHLDFTLSFKNLFENKEYFSQTETFKLFWSMFEKRKKELKADHINPSYIPRTHLIEKAIKLAETGDFSFFHELHECLSSPFETQEGRDSFTLPPTASEVVQNTFCGT